MEVIGGYRFSQIVEGHRKYLSGITDSVLDRRGNVKDSIVLLDGPSKHWAGFNFSRFIFSGAILADSPLFFDSNFEWAKFSYCQMRGASFMDCNFKHADLDYADLTGSTFIRCDFEGATMRGAALEYAYFQDCTNIPYIPMSCPETGAFVAYKIGYGMTKDVLTLRSEMRVIKLEIPEDARRSSATGRKCRASKAKVLSIESVVGDQSCDCARSTWDPDFIYKVGETYEIKHFDGNRFNECAPGIHFFLGRNEALRYAGFYVE